MFSRKQFSLTTWKLGQCRCPLGAFRTQIVVLHKKCLSIFQHSLGVTCGIQNWPLQKVSKCGEAKCAECSMKSYIMKKGLIRTLVSACINTRTLQCHHHQSNSQSNQTNMFKFVSYNLNCLPNFTNFRLNSNFQLTIFVLALVGLASAKPQPQVFVAPAEVVSPYVVSQSSQYFARNYNGVAAAYAVESPVVSSLAYSAYPYSAYYL